jgi:hypothetical protein
MQEPLDWQQLEYQDGGPFLSHASPHNWYHWRQDWFRIRSLRLLSPKEVYEISLWCRQTFGEIEERWDFRERVYAFRYKVDMITFVLRWKGHID